MSERQVRMFELFECQPTCGADSNLKRRRSKVVREERSAHASRNGNEGRNGTDPDWSFVDGCHSREQLIVSLEDGAKCNGKGLNTAV